MIKLTSLSKYYNKGKSNELHVINNVSAEFPENGFIIILGKSGSGKTTLLNAIGGLDRFQGKIQYGENVFDGYQMKDIDKLRNSTISYIFQNYLVLPEQTVYENVDTGLKIAGIQDEKERKVRINASLKAVGMTRYRRKLANALSGGQKQRIGIARAIAKLPKVIIADEPTGNLDSENSVEIMRILKDISKKCLIIMVSHNENLAWAFADKIIYYKDSKIVEEVENTPENRAKYNLNAPKAEDSKIYLSDYEKKESKLGNTIIEVYENKDSNIKLNIKLIEKGGKKYLFVDDDNVVINDPSLTIEEVRPEVQKEKEYDLSNSTFDSSKFDEGTSKKPVSFWTLFVDSLKSFFTEKKMKTGAFKILTTILGLGLTAVSIVTYFTFFTSEYSKTRQSIDTNSVSVMVPQTFAGVKKDDLKPYYFEGYADKATTGIKGLVTNIQINSSSFGFGKIAGSNSSYAVANVLVPQVNGNNPYPTIGEPAENSNEIMVSTGAINLAMPEYLSRGYSYNYLLGKEFFNKSGNRLISNASDVTPVITGIVRNDKPFIYLSEEGSAGIYDALLSTSSMVDVPGSYSTTATFTLLDKVEFKTREDVQYTVDIDDSLRTSAINVIVSKNVKYLFNTGFAVDSNIYNIVGELDDSVENVAVFDDNDDYERFLLIEGAYSLYHQAVRTNIPSDIELVEGRLPSAPNEYLVSSNNSNDLGYVGNTAEIVGKYKAKSTELGYAYADFSTVVYRNYANINNLAGNFFGDISQQFKKSALISVYTSDSGATKKYFESIGLDFVVKSTNEALNDANVYTLQSESKITILVVCSVIIVLFFLVSLLATRSNMIRHIYMISVYRSLGASRAQIYKMFIAKDLSNYLLTMFAAIFISYIGVWITLAALGLFNVPFYMFIFTALASYLMSFLGTIIPLASLLKKSPVEISTKFDI